MEFVKYVDVLIDGRFILGQRNLKCKWRGSENQRVIDVTTKLKTRKKLYCIVNKKLILLALFGQK